MTETDDRDRDAGRPCPSRRRRRAAASPTRPVWRCPVIRLCVVVRGMLDWGRRRGSWWVALVLALCACDPAGDDGQDAGPVCPRLEARLRGCGLLTEGAFGCTEPDGEDCVASCAPGASCDDLRAMSCEGLAGSGTELDRCIGRCADRLDARCDNGGCPRAVFTCSDGSSVEQREACDGQADCADGSDELGCPVFTCDDGTEIPARRRCKGGVECPDGSDELGCAEPVCDGG